jgi:hypothetical protein
MQSGHGWAHLMVFFILAQTGIRGDPKSGLTGASWPG